MTTLQDLMAQRESLERQIKEAKKHELADVIAQITSLIKQYDLTERDLFSSKKKSASETKKVSPKYRDPASGQTWTGRGKAPKWIEGKNRDAFRI